MSQSTLSALITLLQSARAIDGTRSVATGSCDVYSESIDHAVGSVLEFASALLAEVSVKQSTTDEPFEDFGVEPLSREDAVKQAPEFIARCQSLLESPSGPWPYTAMSVRAQTFACQLLEPSDVEGRER